MAATGTHEHIDGAGVVITGGAGGIGRALARRLADGGARIVINDLDADAARDAAAEIGGHAVPGDAASTDGVQALLEAAGEHLGEIDLFCANAGSAIAGGPEATDEQWWRSFEVNVMAHVRAARALLPGWLDRGRGRFLVTASAAGLLSMLGSAPYSVTKHGAVAFAEWLAATYGHRGIAVQCLCPQGVNTAMLPDVGSAGGAVLADSVIEPEEVAREVWDALADDRFLILPHPEVARFYAQRAGDPDRWLAGMGRLQQRIDTA